LGLTPEIYPVLGLALVQMPLQQLFLPLKLLVA
jgi:hypothetical protein